MSLRARFLNDLGFFWSLLLKPGNETCRFIFRIQILKVKVSVCKP